MQMLTAKDVAHLLNLPLPRVYELTRQKLIPVVRMGARQIRYDQDALQQWIRQGGAINVEEHNNDEVSDERE